MALVLRNGTVIEDVTLAWGKEVVRVGGGEPLDLPIDQVIDVIDRSDDSRR